jgi:hypothetical protein
MRDPVSRMRAFFPATLLVSLGLVLSAAPARAGDRGLYLHFLPVVPVGEVAPEAQARAEAFAEALERTLFECGEQPISACRSTRITGSAADGGLQWVYVPRADAVPEARRVAAFRNARGARDLRAWVRRQPGELASLDGLLLHQPTADGGATLVAVNMNTGASRRFTIGPPADGRPALSSRVRARLQTFLTRGWVP